MYVQGLAGPLGAGSAARSGPRLGARDALGRVPAGRDRGRVPAVVFEDGQRDAREAFDAPQQRHLLEVAERERDAGLAGARRASDTVDVIFRDMRQFEIDHVR